MSRIRFVYFDLGNVLLHFDHGIACSRIAAESPLSTAEVERVIFSSGLQEQFETGIITGEEYARRILEAAEWKVPPAEVLRVCSDIFELNASIVPVIAHLRAAQHRLGILSNTCSAHWDWVFNGTLRSFDAVLSKSY